MKEKGWMVRLVGVEALSKFMFVLVRVFLKAVSVQLY